ncbi:MAG: cell division protein FtsQ [Odoribacter sp.]|nr:cell division protein FtsQ [Odoribacter sp.]
MELITKGYGDIVNKNITEINKDSIEQILIKNSAIKSAQVYYSLDGYLHAEIKQRKPVLRVISNESGYYVDEEGKIMPLSRKYSSRVVVATGNISQDYAQEELYPFAMYLKEDKFWDAFIEQIVVKGKNNVSLIPKTGNFSIVMGSLENAEKKMENLRLFLKEGITKRGWNAYKEINLKFDNQIVCVKR